MISLIDELDIDLARRNKVILWCDATNQCFWISEYYTNKPVIDSMEQRKEFFTHHDAVEWCQQNNIEIVHDDGGILSLEAINHHLQLHQGNHD